MMHSKSKLVVAATVLVAITTLSSCGNTIRGVGRDAANTVDATQNAGANIDAAASN